MSLMFLRGMPYLAAGWAAIGAPLAQAADAASRPAYVPPASATVSSGSILQVLFSLALVLGVIALVVWLIKRITSPQPGARETLKIISGIAVGQRERVILLEVDRTWLVVGVAPGSVRTLHTLPKVELLDEEIQQAAELDEQPGKFKAWLKQVTERRNAS